MTNSATVAVLVVVLALSGCAMEPPTADSPQGPSVSEPPSAPAEPTPEPTRPPPDALALAPGSLNLLVVGAPAPGADDPTAMIEFDAEACVDADTGITAGDPNAGRWGAVPDYVDASGGPLFRVGVSESGTVSALQIYGPSTVLTTEGIGIGSTLSELQNAYPTMAGPTDAVLSRLYVVDEGSGRLVFEVSWSGGVADYWTADELDRVVVMTAQATDVAAYAVWATDGGVGSCLR